MTRRLRLWPLGLLLPVACAGPAQERGQPAPDAGAPPAAQPGDDREEDAPEEAATGEGGGASETAPADPYSQRPGGTGEGSGDDPPPDVAFLAPLPGQAPVDPAERPSLPRSPSLAVVVVRDGLLEGDPSVLLGLEGQLSADAFARVVALRPPDMGAADLGDLAAAAEEAEHDLLLVVDASDEEERRWRAWLVHAKSGRLVGRHTAEDVPAGGSAAPRDAYDRVARAFGAAFRGS